MGLTGIRELEYCRDRLCGPTIADFTLSRHVAPTKNGFTDAAIKQV